MAQIFTNMSLDSNVDNEKHSNHFDLATRSVDSPEYEKKLSRSPCASIESLDIIYSDDACEKNEEDNPPKQSMSSNEDIGIGIGIQRRDAMDSPSPYHKYFVTKPSTKYNFNDLILVQINQKWCKSYAQENIQYNHCNAASESKTFKKRIRWTTDSTIIIDGDSYQRRVNYDEVDFGSKMIEDNNHID